MNKFFTLEVKPTIAASKQALGAFADGDVLADWFAFDIPNGGNLLRDAYLITKPNNSFRQTHAVEAHFAKTINGFAPNTIGTVHGTASGSVAAYQNHLIGYMHTEEDPDTSTTLDNVTIQRFMMQYALYKQVIPGPNFVFQGEPDTGATKGFSRLYVALTAIDGDVNFVSTVQVDGNQTKGTTSLTVKTTQARSNFGLGDELVDEDGVRIGTITGSNSAITATNIPLGGPGGLLNDMTNNKDVYTTTPMRLILSFER
tara:strand:- start:48 stop:818 length:771 start_codon:yes stop_codon:yes gene_type:complete